MKLAINGDVVSIFSGGSSITMDDVNQAINEAIYGAIEKVYYGAEASSESV